MRDINTTATLWCCCWLVATATFFCCACSWASASACTHMVYACTAAAEEESEQPGLQTTWRTTCRLKHHLQASTQAVKPKTTLLKWLHRHSMAHRDAALHLPTQTTQATHHILQNAIALGQQLSLLGFLLLVVGPQPLNLSLAAKQGAA